MTTPQIKKSQEYRQTYKNKPKNSLDNNAANELLGRVPPQAKEMEREVIGAILLGAVKMSDLLPILDRAEMFYDSKMSLIYEKAISVSLRGNQPDLLTVVDEFKKSGTIDEVGGHYELTKLTADCFMNNARAMQYAKHIKGKYIGRELIQLCNVITNQAFEEELDTNEIIYGLNLELEKLSQQSTDKPLRAIPEVLVDVYAQIEQQINQTVEFNGVPTGFEKLNKVTGGWQKTDLIILAARPSVGKSAFSLNLAYAASQTEPTAFFSLEMGADQLAKRLISISTRIPLEEVTRPYTIVDKEAKMRTIATDVNLQNRKLFFDDTPGLKVSQVKAKCISLKKKHGLGLVIIDYLQLMEGEGRNGNREQEISKISRDLKKMAKELDVPVIALSQLSRSIETRGGDGIPKLADLRESGAIEQDADIVAFLYNATASEIEKIPEMRQAAHLHIQKHRNGALEDLLFVKNLAIQTFSESRDILQYGGSQSFTPFEEQPYNPHKGFEQVADDLPF